MSNYMSQAEQKWRFDKANGVTGEESKGKKLHVSNIIEAIKNLRTAITDAGIDPYRFAFCHPEYAKQIRDTDFPTVMLQLQKMSARKASVLIPQSVIDQVDQLIMDTYEGVLGIEHEFEEERESYDEHLRFDRVYLDGTKWDVVMPRNDPFHEKFFNQVPREYSDLIDVDFIFRIEE